MISVVLDANVLVAAVRSGGGAARQIVRGCLIGAYEPLFGPVLLAEYEYAILSSRISANLASERERRELLAALVSVGRWVNVYCLWRPNLHDEADNHLVELAVAGGATAIVTYNVRDLATGELLFPSVRVLRPTALLRDYPCLP